MDDAGVGRNDPEVLERPLAPAEELVALAVALVIEIHVGRKGLRRAEGIHLDRVVHHQLHRLERIDPAGIATEVRHGISHRGEVHHRRHPGEVLQQDPGGSEGDLTGQTAIGSPARQRLDVLGGDDDAVLGPQQVFEEDS